MIGLALPFLAIASTTAAAALALSAPLPVDNGSSVRTASVVEPQSLTPETFASANVALTTMQSQPDNPSAIHHRSFRRASDGLFYIHANANGQAVRFVVDTGATVVVLNAEDAARLGLAFDTLQRSARMNTAGGQSAMKWAQIERLEMAGKRLEAVTAAVVDKGLPVSLLGQNALAMLGTVTLRGDVLTID